MNRRSFVRSSAWTALSYGRIQGAAERIGLGVVGVGVQGTINLANFRKQPGVEVLAVCDVDRNHLAAALAKAGQSARGFHDFRRVLDLREVDAVMIATPDHWHAIPAILACQAGKDVYVEKPLAFTVREGRAMVRAARKHKRIVQVGTQQRSGEHFRRAVELVRNGVLGTVSHISCIKAANQMPGWGKYEDGPPPPELDWDFWLGPAPFRPYNPLRCHYNFRWFWETGGGQMSNWGAHHLDTARWLLNARAPETVSALGKRFALTDPGETPDVQEVSYGFPSAVVQFTAIEMNGALGLSVCVHGSKGTLVLTRNGFEIVPETWGNSNLGRGRPRGETARRMSEAMKAPASELELSHIRNFLECVRSRRTPAADVEEGHLSATLCHIGNISTRLGRSLRWDAENEDFVGDPEASRLLDRSYRAPWRLPEV